MTIDNTYWDQHLFPLTDVDYEQHLSLTEKYAVFIAANPNVLDVFERLADQWFRAGNERVGAKFLAEQARWISGLHMPGEAWAINNSYVAFISRDLLNRRPEWLHRIRTREQRAA